MASGQSNWPVASPNWLLVSSNWVANSRIIAYLCSLLMEFIETFYACLGKHFMVMIIIVKVRLIWLGTFVTWLSCRPLVLFLNKIPMEGGCHFVYMRDILLMLPRSRDHKLPLT